VAEGRGCEATRLHFGLFELDLRAGELRKAGARVRLAPQPMQILQLLVLRAGHVVTREEIRQALWPADRPVDFEHNLNTAVKRLRAALGDSAEAPRFIETLPRRGYRFLAPVAALLDSVSAIAGTELAPAVSPVPATQPTRRGVRVAAAAAVVIAFAGITGWLLWPRQPAAEPGVIRSIAVLPFQNLSDDPEQGYFADAMTDTLITSLAKIKTLKVISRTSVLPFERTSRRIPDIAKELQVDAIVEGSVLRAHDTVRITAQLIHGPTDQHLWAESYDGAFNDVLVLQSRVARTIAREIRATLSPAEAANLNRVPRLDPAAYEPYLRGRHLMTRRTEPELRRALEYFERAAATDPHSALPLVGMAQVWDVMASWAGHVTTKEGYPKAKDAALRALALDGTLAEAHTALAAVEELYDWNLEAAERRYQQAIALNPNYAAAHHRYGMLLGRTGRADAALESALRAKTLDPLSLDINMGLAARLAAVRRPQESIARMESVIELDPNYFDSYVHLADAYQRAGDVGKAIATAERGVQLSGRSPHALHGLALVYVRAGDLKKALPLIAELEKHPIRNAYDIGTLYLIMKRPEPAIRWLQQACEDRVPAMAFIRRATEANRQFDVIRNDPRFTEILRCAD
jgi:TolB-like protein/DNA-binding winged helix-turn-helix (wHTH) protein